MKNSEPVSPQEISVPAEISDTVEVGASVRLLPPPLAVDSMPVAAIATKMTVIEEGDAVERKRWRVVGASVQGSGHVKANLPCQDACHWHDLPGQTLIVAVADGAGSASISEVGAQIASKVAVEQAATEVRQIEIKGLAADDEAWKSALIAAITAAREAVEAEATLREVKSRELATTLIVVIATPELVAASQVGDGAAVVADANGAIWPLTVPQTGEYINETTFIISPKALETVQMMVRRGQDQRIAAFSDGLQMLALQMPEAIPHEPFFAPLFGFVDKVTDDDAAHEELKAFLRSPRVQQRAADDLTLVLASLQS